MKKIYSFLFATVTIFSAASCQKEVDNTPVENTDVNPITITAVNATTKTTLVDALKTYWTSADELSVFDFTGVGRKFTTDITENQAEATFTNTDANFVEPADLSAACLVALYPYDSDAVVNYVSAQTPPFTISNIELPAEQTAAANNFDPSATLAVAQSIATNTIMTFNNLYSLLKFTVAESGLKEVVVKANSTEKIAGAATITNVATEVFDPQLNPGSPVLVIDPSTGSSEVTLTCSEGFATDKTYYIAVAPGAYTDGLSVYVDDELVKTTKLSEGKTTLKTNYVYNLGQLRRKSGWDIKIGDNNIPLYKKGDYYVAESVTFAESDNYTIVNTSQSESIRGIAGVTPTNKWCYLYKSEGSMTISEGTYDIYVNPSNATFVVVAADQTVPEFTYENQALYFLYENTDWIGLYGWTPDPKEEFFGEWNNCSNNSLGTFKTHDNKSCSYWNIPSKYYGKKIYIIVRNDEYNCKSHDTEIQLSQDLGGYQSDWTDGKAKVGTYDFHSDKGYTF